MDALTAARHLIGHTLAFHIVIVAISIGLPILMSIFEWRAYKHNDARARSLVKLLSRWAAVFVIGGIFTGTAVALQMSTLWAPFMNGVRPNVGMFFQLEGYMFLIEAVFLSWYFATMKQVGTLRHFLISLPISLGTLGSAFFITAVNAYMNNPTGKFTSTTWLESFHSGFSYIFAVVTLVLGYLAWRSLRKQTKPTRQFLAWTMGRLGIIAGILLVILAILGHQSAVDIAHTQPHKLAAIELLDTTQTNAPVRIGGEIDASGKATGGIVIPGALSWLVGWSGDTKVKGLNEFPRDSWPYLIVHLLFDAKMLLVGIACLGTVLVVWYYWRRKDLPRWLRIALIPFGLIGLVLMELGWLITEFGRQQWAIVGKQTVAQGFTGGADIKNAQYLFIALFAILSVATIFALIQTTRHWRKTEKLSW